MDSLSLRKSEFKVPEISIVLPCRNEEKSLPFCLKQINWVVFKAGLNAEIIVSDSSVDRSAEIAKSFGARVIKHNKKGYGIAYLEGFKQAKGKYIFMADCDGTYDFNEIPKFVEALRKGYDFVIGDRFAYKFGNEVMPWTHKYIGNPILSGILRLFFKTSVRDSHCGMRAVSRSALDKLKLQTVGMEFASEMIVKALKCGLKIKEFPIKYKPRIGESKLSTWRDGWRHLRFMLLYSPLFLFFIPGFTLFVLGLLSFFWLYFGLAEVFGTQLYVHPMFISSLFMIIGYQLMIFALFAKTYAITHLNEKSPLEKLYRYVTIEKAGIIGGVLVVLGVGIYGYIFLKWVNSGFGSLDEVKNLVVAQTFAVIGVQTIFSAFMLSILGIKER
ncbi:glycosyltransferase family 2 protein [archaeon]|jgi:glycosyltransferase involved in cell wall biosynthesis|nr:glycosyltransferase family 2 protein [archaeon]